MILLVMFVAVGLMCSGMYLALTGNRWWWFVNFVGQLAVLVWMIKL